MLCIYIVKGFTSKGVVRWDFHTSLEDAVQEIIDYGCSNYIETLHRSDDDVKAISILPNVRAVERNRREEVEHEATEGMKGYF